LSLKTLAGGLGTGGVLPVVVIAVVAAADGSAEGQVMRASLKAN